MRVGRLEQGPPELFQWRAGHRWIHGSAAAHRTCGQHGHRAACTVEAALEGTGPDARAFVQRYVFAHRLQVLSIPQVEVPSSM